MDLINQLDERNTGLGAIIFECKQSIDLYKIIALNADGINKTSTQFFFAHVQMLAAQSIILSFCKIYEQEKHHPLHSIPAILSLLENHNPPPKHTEAVKTFIMKHNSESPDIPAQTPHDLLCEVQREYESELKRYKDVRDKSLAHGEYRENVGAPLPSYDVMERLLNFAIDFYSMIHEAYTGIKPAQLKNDVRTLTDAVNVLRAIGLKDIKTDFLD